MLRSLLAAPVVLGLLLGAVGGAGRLRAEEPPAAPAPAAPDREAAAARARAVCEALPAPAAERAFRFEGEYVMKGRVLGPAVVELALASEGDAPRWATLEEITLALGAGRMRVRLEALLDARLDAWSGRSLSEIDPQSRVEVVWRRDGDAYHLERTETAAGETARRSGVLAAVRPLKASLTALVAFCRALPAEPATYALDVLDTEPNMGTDPGQRLRLTTLEVLGAQPWSSHGRETPAWVVRRQDVGRDPVLLAFSPDAERRFLGLHSPERGLELRLREEPSVRAALPVPVPADPDAGVAGTPPSVFEGLLVFHGARLGTVRLEAQPARRGGAPCWHVVERTVREAGRGRVVQELSLFLAPDLTLLQGESLYRSPSGASVTSFGRRDGRMEVVESEEGGAARSASVEVPADASMGLWAASRFAAALQAAERAQGRLPMFDPRFAFPDDQGVLAPAGWADLAFESEVAQDQGLFEAYEVTARSGRHLVLRPGRGGEVLAGVRGVRPGADIVPAASAGPLPAPDWFDRVGEAPRSALQAFCAFGRGYHLPDRALLESSFHWPSMLAHEVQAGTFPPGTKDAQVRAYYVAEFERMSKHRTEADCDDLLVQLLLSATITTHADGSVTIASLPVFGGHSYTLRPLDGRWFLVAID